MSYSAVDPSPHWPQKNVRTVSTRLAYSDDRGATWSDAGIVNAITETVDSREQRTWSHEVSSLAFDPTAPPNARWKLFWHHYPAIGADRQFQHGWIAYKEAPSPEGLRLAPEIKLFGAKGYNSVNDNERGPTGSPVGGPPKIRVATLGAGAADCVALSEPDAMVLADGLYMAVGCYSVRLLPPGITSRILIVKCRSPCEPANAAAWRLVGTVLTERDAKSLGAQSFSASDLFSRDRAFYLMVSPVGKRPFPDAYNGGYVFRFTNLDAGTLERSSGKPTVIEEVQGRRGSFNGACTYAQNVSAAGFLYSELELAATPIFHIFKGRPKPH